jgi:hypothetical protein
MRLSFQAKQCGTAKKLVLSQMFLSFVSFASIVPQTGSLLLTTVAVSVKKCNYSVALLRIYFGFERLNSYKNNDPECFLQCEMNRMFHLITCVDN